MQNSMIIDVSISSKEIKTRHDCPCKNCKGDNKTIPTFYSEKHASRGGWKKTRHLKFCEPGKTYVWVCPDCAAAFDWTAA